MLNYLQRGDIMTKKEIALNAVEALKTEYPDAICSLTYNKPHELLIATRLSAQCTDARVNMVTPALFERYQTIDELAEAEVSDVAEYIKSCGLYKTKSKDIVNMCIMLRDNFGGEVPDNIDDLTKLPGVGRKTANLICGDVYGKPAVVVDTHCIRITTRLGLHKLTDQKKIEMELKKLLPRRRATIFATALCSTAEPSAKRVRQSAKTAV